MIKENENDKDLNYQFIPIPLNLWMCMDLNCRSMLGTLIQLSSYYAKEDGWFFRTNEDLRVESSLSENLVRATLSTFYRIGIIDVMTVGKGKSKTPNKFRLDVSRFGDWEKYSLDDCMKHPDFRIETDNYKAKGWQPSYMKMLENEAECDSIDNTKSLPTLPQSEDYIENIDIKEHILSEGSPKVEVKSSAFEEYKKQEDYLMGKLYNVLTWTDFNLFKREINKLISTAASDKIAEKTKKRYQKIEEGKIKFFKSKMSKEPYNPLYDDFYREYDCSWLGKVNTDEAVITESQQLKEERDENADWREMFILNGWEIPESLQAKRPQQEGREFRPIDDDNLPF